MIKRCPICGVLGCYESYHDSYEEEELAIPISMLFPGIDCDEDDIDPNDEDYD